jgi:gliding motility-associated-like protein
VVVLFITPAPDASISASAGDTICYGTSDTLTASGGTSYNWIPTGDTTATIIVTPTSTTDYTVIVGINNGCFDTSIVQVVVLPAGIPAAGADQSLCAGDSVSLSSTVADATGVKWTTSGDGTFIPNDSVFTPIYIPGTNDTTNHFVQLIVTAVGACINFSDTVNVTISTVPDVFAGNDTSIAKSASLQLNGQILNATGGMWTTSGSGTFDPDDTTLAAVYHPSQSDLDADSVILYLTTSGGCRVEIDSIIVRFVFFQIPNVFTPYPNSPGYNDYFEITGLPDGSTLRIWDRWGLLVFESDNYRNDWDAAQLNSDTYYYILTTPEKEYKGWVKVLREN